MMASGFIEPKSLPSLEQEPESEHERDQMQNCPNWQNRRSLCGQPTPALDAGCSDSAQQRITTQTSQLKSQHGLTATITRSLPQACASRTAHGHAVGPTEHTHHQGRDDGHEAAPN